MWIQDHLGTLYQLAAVVSSVALCFFGSPLFGVTSLLILALGFMDRNGYLPLAVRQIVHRYSEPVMIVTGLVTGGVVQRIVAALSILSWGINTYFSGRRTNRNELLTIWEENGGSAGHLSPLEMQDYLRDVGTPFQINRRYVHYNPLPPVPDIDIQELVTKFNEIDWAHHMHALRSKLALDPRFITRRGDPGQYTDAQIIAFTRDTLQAFVTAVVDRNILAGEPVDYQKMDNYLKFIAAYVAIPRPGIANVSALLRVAVDGGEYCGPGKFQVVEELVAELFGEAIGVPLLHKIAYCLQTARNLWMEGFYNRLTNGNPVNALLGIVVDWNDRHQYNIVQNIYGVDLGLRMAGAENDSTAVVNAFSKLFISLTIGRFIRQLFWESHTLPVAVEVVSAAIGTTAVPKPEVYAFWLEWINRQDLEEPAKEALREELAGTTPSLYGVPLEINGSINPKFIVLMLLDMGIAERMQRS